MISKETVLSLIENKLEEDGAYIVDLKISTSNEITLLIDSFEGVNISYCVDISRQIEHNLDREEEDFMLEVSSAGIGPFKVWNQFKKYEGEEVLVKAPDQKPQKGILKDLTETAFKIEFTEKVKEEGKKKKIEVTREIAYNIDEIISAEPVLKF